MAMVSETGRGRAGPFVKVLLSEMEHQGLSSQEICRRAGLGINVVNCWKRGAEPIAGNLEAALNVVGKRLTIVDLDQ